jgi:hypothetical protein
MPIINSNNGIYKHVIRATNIKVRTFLIVGMDPKVASECVFTMIVINIAKSVKKNSVIKMCTASWLFYVIGYSINC